MNSGTEISMVFIFDEITAEIVADKIDCLNRMVLFVKYFPLVIRRGRWLGLLLLVGFLQFHAAYVELRIGRLRMLRIL